MTVRLSEATPVSGGIALDLVSLEGETLPKGEAADAAGQTAAAQGAQAKRKAAKAKRKVARKRG